VSLPQIVLGSRNKKKIGEMLDLLGPQGIDVVGIAEFPGVPDVVEDGDSFAANAEKKARETALAVERWVIAEDSGLCVDALGGAPGIYSARFAGTQGDDAANNAKLLRELADVPDEQRTAHYLCHAVFVDPQGNVRARAEGRCHGRILRDHHGTNGFGYDPMFLVPEYNQTFGQLDAAIKQRISHRAKAFAELIPQIVRVLKESTQ
jgi:XTP/dITP diphosphohydrolase